jgi:uncharacterized DUF497 family protein
VRFVQIIWDDENDPLGNVQHIAEHGLTVGDVEAVLSDPESEGFSKSSDRPCCFGYTPGGEFIIVIYEEIERDSAYPVTAFHVPEP